jgi:heat shock protein 1/8
VRNPNSGSQSSTPGASPGAASCAVESLKSGLDYAGTVDRMRFDMEAKPVYAKVARAITALLEGASVDEHQIDAAAFVGGAGCLPGLQDAAPTQTSSTGLQEDVEVADADPTEIVAIGCALQADLLAPLHTEEDKDIGMLLRSVHDGAEKHKDERVHSEAAVLSRTLGVLFPDAKAENKELGGEWVPLLKAETALPARRTVEVEVLAG